MPNHGAKVSSAYLSNDVMRQFVATLPAVLQGIYGNRDLTVYYGWACNLHSDLLYKPMSVSLEAFPYFIEDSSEQRIFEFGSSDLLIESPDSNLQILICYESDIHLDGTNDDAINRIIVEFPNIDFRTADQWKTEP